MIPAQSTFKNSTPHDPLTTFLIYALLLVMALFFLMPIYVFGVNSLKPLEEIQNRTLFALPNEWTLEPWRVAWSSAKIGLQPTGLKPFFLNSFMIAVPAVVISTGLGALNGYILNRWRFLGSEVLYTLMLIACFIPFQVILIPMAHLLGHLGLSQSLLGLVFAHVIYGLGISTMFFRKYYQRLPVEILHAAQIDGAGFLTIFYRILLPLSGPIIVVCAVWQFITVWNDFLLGTSLAGIGAMPVTVALNHLVASSTSVKAYNVHLAAALIAALPTLIVYALCGRLFMRGLTSCVVKG